MLRSARGSPTGPDVVSTEDTMDESPTIDRLDKGHDRRSVSGRTVISFRPGSGRALIPVMSRGEGREAVQTFAVLKVHSIDFGGNAHGS